MTVLEAMAQSAASLPVTPYFGPKMFQNHMPFSLRDPENESYQFGTHKYYISLSLFSPIHIFCCICSSFFVIRSHANKVMLW